MIEVLRTPSLSEALAARVSLEGAGIEAVLGEELVSGAYGIPFRVLVLRDEEAEEARRVLAEGEDGGGAGG